jgi:choline dehydrogenase-like flavoprotein
MHKSGKPLAKSYVAIVVGSGASGGLAALSLTEAGLNVLVLDAAWHPSFVSAPYRRAVATITGKLANPELLPYIPPSLIYKTRKVLRILGGVRQPIQTKCYAWERCPDAFIDDLDSPYTTHPDHPFTWLRTRVTGGRMIVPGHGRQYFRLGDDDFAPTDGQSPQWPVTLHDLAPWYASVEKRLGLSGNRDGLPWLPDSDIRTPLAASPSEAKLQQQIAARWPASRPIMGRYAPPLDSIAQASKTGRLTFRAAAIGRDIITDAKGRAQGVTWLDAATGATHQTTAPIVFLCASALESTRILLLSKNADGKPLGAASGMLGRNLMDHIMLKAEGIGGALENEPVMLEDGRCVYLPRFDARDQPTVPPGRGYGVQLYQLSATPGSSYFTAVSFSEMLPRTENTVQLDATRKDRWGIPVLHIDCHYSQQELSRTREQATALREIAALTGAKLHDFSDTPPPPGSAIHECGTARMGADPATSVLDPHNQCWDAKGLYVTDSASFPSQGSQNPTLTVMALTARACAHALAEAGHKP